MNEYNIKIFKKTNESYSISEVIELLDEAGIGLTNTVIKNESENYFYDQAFGRLVETKQWLLLWKELKEQNENE